MVTKMNCKKTILIQSQLSPEGITRNSFLPMMFFLVRKSGILTAIDTLIYYIQGRNSLQIDTKTFISKYSKRIKYSIENRFSEATINRIAKETGFVQRIRKLPPGKFVNSLMFSISNQANTSLPDITADLSQQFNIDLSKEGLHKKFTQQSVSFLKALISEQFSQQMPSSIDSTMLKQFKCIKIKDSSKFSLPTMYEGDYPGFGNFSKKNGVMNLQCEYDLLQARWETISLSNIKINDQRNSGQTTDTLTEAGLHIRDLGYITHTYLKACITKGAFFLNRMPTQISICDTKRERINWKKIDIKLKKTGLKTLDMDVQIYAKDPLACRMILERVSDNEYAIRLKNAENSAKSHGVGVSKEHKLRCRYNLFITNAGRKKLPTKAIRKVYGLRWQIELIFKTWKSFYQIDKVKKVKKERLECQLLAKFLWILLNWDLFIVCNHYVQKCNPEKGVSILKFFKRCLHFSVSLRMVVLKKLDLSMWLCTIFIPLIDSTACEPPWKKMTHYQSLKSCLS